MPVLRNGLRGCGARRDASSSSAPGTVHQREAGMEFHFPHCALIHRSAWKGRPDTLRGTKEDDNLIGKGANDTLLPLAGDDTLLGGPGKDVVNGGSFAEPLAGNKNLVGGEGNDAVEGGLGSDNVLGGEGNDYLFGGEFEPPAVKDTLSGADGDEVIDVLNDPAAKDIVTCGSGLDRVLADRADVVAPDCEKVSIGPAAADRFFNSIPQSFIEGLPPQFL